MTDAIIQKLFAFAMTDDEWRRAGCPVPGTVTYARAAAEARRDYGETLWALNRYLIGVVAPPPQTEPK
jgi:hypothetical protein